jgi:Na+-translocating ferredoxin:NAD+ oxidoreductase subunit A
MTYVSIIVLALFVNNIVLAQFLGINPLLGSSQKTSDAMGMGGAVILIQTVAGLLTILIQNYILTPLGAGFLQTLVFILVIALLVQITNILLKESDSSFSKIIKIHLTQITINSAVLGVAILAVQQNYSVLQAVVFSFSTSVGFAISLILLSGMREQVELNGVPESMKGLPIIIITLGLLSLAFMGFAGLAR